MSRPSLTLVLLPALVLTLARCTSGDGGMIAEKRPLLEQAASEDLLCAEEMQGILELLEGMG